ncbi:hypothetical protein BUALT_Bualt18G0011000 [Buddleja alternifolia]|uniref:BAH domain-containing protein n=1 Tax=Buddleja alternifolia TaxID=168488 RepID=A0AAV6W3Y0_9LAMI|nr:hypothetical protein BUALT_Bualt18G0011000 [Buddleja alternifolia]
MEIKRAKIPLFRHQFHPFPLCRATRVSVSLSPPQIKLKFGSELKTAMAKTKLGKKDLDSYTIKGTNKVVRSSGMMIESIRLFRPGEGPLDSDPRNCGPVATVKHATPWLAGDKSHEAFCLTMSRGLCLLLAVSRETKVGHSDMGVPCGRALAQRIKVGDCDSDKPPYVTRVEKLEADHWNNVEVRLRWYYRPKESIGGRRQFHGAKELFLSDHFDVQSAHIIEGKCSVHTFKNYTKLENVGVEDYFCRFEYNAATGSFTPDRVAVFCKCEIPYNSDDAVVALQHFCKCEIPYNPDDAVVASQQ